MLEPTYKTISFFGTCTANSEKTLVSPRISTPYAVKTIIANFALNTNRTLQLDFYIAPDNDAPTSGRPSGMSLMREYGQIEYVVGDDEKKEFQHQAFSPTSPSWLKIYANNTDSFDHTIDCHITIQLLPRE